MLINQFLNLNTSSSSVPNSAKKNDASSSPQGTIFYDSSENAQTKKEYLSMYTWIKKIEFLYADLYLCRSFGLKELFLSKGGNKIVFNDVAFDGWDHDNIPHVTAVALETRENLSYLIGLFDVDMINDEDLPLIDPPEFRNLKFVFDGNFSDVERDKRKFEVFFLDTFGKKYANVRWHNATVSKGSVKVEAIITGPSDQLEDTADAIADDVVNGRADIQYVEGTTWRASEVNGPIRRLLQEANQAQKTEEPVQESGGLSVAWIAAIVINVILIVLFISVVVYCYCKNRKERRLSQADSLEKDYKRNGDITYVEKAATQMKGNDKTALIGTDTVYTVEGERGRHRHPDDHFDSRGDRCTCNSPQCYCSMGDEDGVRPNSESSTRRLEQRFHEDDDVEDVEPQLPSPEPQPRYLTPQPSPILEPEDLWRPESEDEKEEDARTYIPGSVSPPPVIPAEKHYRVYRVMDTDGSRENIGVVVSTSDITLSELRKHIQRDGTLATAIDGKAYRFFNEELQEISPFQESTLDMEQAFPYQSVNIQYIKKAKVTRARYNRPRVPVYVGPLGICSAPDCTEPSRIKCLDCGNTAYCSTKCIRMDLPDHRKVCYKPPWRI